MAPGCPSCTRLRSDDGITARVPMKSAPSQTDRSAERLWKMCKVDPAWNFGADLLSEQIHQPLIKKLAKAACDQSATESVCHRCSDEISSPQTLGSELLSQSVHSSSRPWGEIYWHVQLPSPCRSESDET